MSSFSDESDPVFEMIDSLSEKELDALPYGIIQLDSHGVVLRYNEFEGVLPVLPGNKSWEKNFFKQVAPCTEVQEFYGRFQLGIAARRLHCKFRFHFDFQRSAPRDVTIKLFYSDRYQTVWVLVQPIESQR